ncbi:TAP-like protein-domain-containing protein [Crucibulum laeve]|uniref:TAP-like protein-domain-containing protein n=1 Tax=Crucibulum laeve TaxID=68775 RepID=A0A5C3LQQ1_9AGAR|nr:TAP-like protein-domain-containing protein [Crucibulum laeve]
MFTDSNYHKRRRRVLLRGLAFTVVFYAVLWLIERNSGFVSENLASLKDARVAGEQEFTWEELIPSTELVWKDCYTGKQCARLIVPLNYSDPQGEKATIAVIKKPSLLAIDSKDYKGPVLLNPGGPGGSGVEFMQRAGDSISTILGPQFDTVSFDPRGIGRSTPRASFFKTDAERAMWPIRGHSVINNTDEGISRTWARAVITGKLAEEMDTGYLRHINTDQTARDMLTIVEAFGQKKIQYWGFSYGSVLGATFASIFPDKIHRLAIDGVVDAENYFATLWSNNLLDTDKTMRSFFVECAKAGPDRCPFYAPTPQDIAKNLTALYESVRKQPVPVRTETSYGLLDYSRLRSTVFVTLYQPYSAFLPLAQGLADLAARADGTTLYKILETPFFECSCGPGESILDGREAQSAILCNDGKDVPGDLKSAEKFFKDFAKESEWAEIWGAIRMNCVAWPKFPKNHFQGPFIANTSHPILLIGNTADPVTPLWAAKKMSRGFNGSVVLTQDSPGHCSLSAPSLCTQQHIRDYFQTGALPKAGTICSVEASPFPEKKFDSDGQEPLWDGMTEGDRGLLEAAHALSKSYSLPIPF